MSSQFIGAKYGGAGGASAPPALSDRSAGGASVNTVSRSNTVYKIDVTLFISTKYTKML